MSIRRKLYGKVVSAGKCDKTITVEVANIVKHPLYKKFLNRKKRYAVHDPENKVSLGQTISIIENKPISKTKKWIAVYSE